MYKVFINDKPIIISEIVCPDNTYPTLRFSEGIVDEAIYKLKYGGYKGFNLLTTSIEEAWSLVTDKYPVVSAAGGLVINQNKEILFIKRFNKWDLPKGKIEKGEQKQEAAIREVEEECGVSNLNIHQFLLTTYHFYKIKGRIKIKETFWYLMHTDYQDTLIPQIEESITEVCFKNEQQVIQALQNTYANIRLVYETFLNKMTF